MSFLFSILIFCFIYYLFNKKIFVYKIFSGVIYKDNVIELFLSDDELLLFYKNMNMFIDDNKVKIKIIKVENDILHRGGVFYNQLFLDVKLNNTYKVNDVVKVSVVRRKMKIFNIFKIIWEGD